MHVKDTTQPVDTSKLGGSATGKFRVVASDGVNTAFADSPTFVMANKPPVVHISLPATNINVHWGQLVNFSGVGLDLQDGQVADGNLVWTNGATVLGTGPQISVFNLPNGVNTVTLTAANSKGQHSSASVTVTVNDNIEPDGPTMQVAPGSVSWNVADGTTALQSSTLNVSNYGSGSLTWQVTSNAAWLTTTASSGAEGDNVTVKADPTGMVSGEVRTSTLTFTTSSNGSLQTVQVPVSLVMGNIYQSPFYETIIGYRTYLPAMRK